MKKHHIFQALCIVLLAFLAACSDKNEDSAALRNDCIKRSLGPNVVGLDIEFAYAMALPRSAGKITSAQVEATIAGAAATLLENKSYYTDASGKDVGITIGLPSTTTGGKTEVTFTTDTCAATLRYYYRIPEEARGKEVSFTFTAKASNGETVTYAMGPYTIAKMDMKLDMAVSNGANCYISVADMAVYNATDAAANAGKIDLVYLYRKITGITFEHAFCSPAADPQYLPGITLPTGVSNNTLIKKVYGLRDRHLARLQYGIYVDDPDFVSMNFIDMPNYATNVKNEGGLWVETQDKKYRAYIYVNSINTGGNAVISMKRYTMN